ncbi:hypothetical protein [Accumulibacter sp.]|uniref:hypothetical protein n=1 Tax=Accumulibacter sp. TaxID=2053492 RepID=UPI0025D90E54|nr:hypothetical protein [Accumulibacter sp.]MCM8593866.1 hypothetical protein [Accumulibacter sp.]MCM8626092.1 hypothetical protein [Accumulibacter sp.]MDS4048007.1 hypothetical protein [Accumulibacter sp.]
MLALRAPPRRVARPKADPRFVAVTQQIDAGAARLRKHVPAAQKAREASRSAKAPANERLAGAKAKVVDEVKAAPTPKPQPTSFKALLRAEIDKAMPKTLGDTEKFMAGGQSGAMKGALGGNVATQKSAATGPVDQATKKSPDPGSVPAQASAALPAEPAPQKPAVAAGEGMPPPATPAEVSLDQSKKDTTQALKDERIRPESLTRANDPRFSAVAGAQAQVASQADKAPAAFRARESGVLAGARAQAGGVAGRGALLLAATRGRGNAQVLSRQQQQAAREEAERQKVAAHIEGIFARTKARVEARLQSLDGEVSAIFDPGVDAALTAMKSFVDDRIFKYKLERYLTIPGLGLARWLRDQALGLPDEVNAFYEQGRRVFQAAMDRLIDRVANLVETRLAQAKADVESGQNEIRGFVAGLPANLKAAGDAAAKAVGDRFNELSQSIDAKKEELAASLAQKYKEAFDKADEALKAMQDENKGLLQQFAEKLGEVVKALLEFKARLMGILRKGQETIQLILDDPIAFLGNLIAAVKGGFNAFVGNIWTHLKAGFMAWLFGSLAAMGITLPSDLSLPSILKLVLDVLGITYEKMRAKAVRLIGERAVGAIEKVVEYVRELITGGPAKLWEKIKEDLGNLKQMVIDAIQDWLITTIIKQAVAKVVSMFNPAGAIVQAVIAIYNVVMFVIEKAQQIMALVEAVVNSVAAIASGAIGGAISWIEKSLASAIPVLIGFLARLIGLGGISDKIREFIRKVQSKVDAAIDKVIGKIVATVKKLFGKGGKAGDGDKQKQLEAGEKAILEVAGKYRAGVEERADIDRELAGVKRAHPVFKTIGTRVESGQVYWFYTGSGKKGIVAAESKEWAVGTHEVPRPAAVTKAKGESHHVPQKILLASMGEFYQAVATPIAKVDKPLAERMRSAGKSRLNRYKKDGPGLSAIWLKKKVHKAAHQAQPLKDVEAEAKKLESKGDLLDSTIVGEGAVGGGIAVDKGVSVPATTLPANVSLVGKTPDSGGVTEANVHVQRRHLFAAIGGSLGSSSVGFGRTSTGKRRATAQQIAREKATNAAQAEKLNERASALFKAQWNGLLAGGLTGVNAALGKDDGWRAKLVEQAKSTWAGDLAKP